MCGKLINKDLFTFLQVRCIKIHTTAQDAKSVDITHAGIVNQYLKSVSNVKGEAWPLAIASTRWLGGFYAITRYDL